MVMVLFGLGLVYVFVMVEVMIFVGEKFGLLFDMVKKFVFGIIVGVGCLMLESGIEFVMLCE